MPWITWYNYSKQPGIFGVSDLNNTVNFTMVINTAKAYRNAVYLLEEENTGHFYIGKAISLAKRINSHRASILANIKKATSVKKINSRSLDVHRKFADLYFKTGKLDLKFTVISSAASYHLHTEEKAQILRMLGAKQKDLCFNIAIKKKANLHLPESSLSPLRH